MINYILQGFGFTGWRDFINSSFGHIFSVNFIAVDVVLLVGLGKELYDKYIKKTFIDWWDIVASLTPYPIVKRINKEANG